MEDEMSGLDQFLRPTEAARLLGISRSAFYELTRDRDFPEPYRISRRIRAWRARDLIAWAEARREGNNAC